MPRSTRKQPRELTPGWPTSPSPDPVAEVARRLALNLRDRLRAENADGPALSIRGAEALTGVDHTVIGKVLNGHTWADLATIARLERGLAANLWPSQHHARLHERVDDDGLR